MNNALKYVVSWVHYPKEIPAYLSSLKPQAEWRKKYFKSDCCIYNIYIYIWNKTKNNVCGCECHNTTVLSKNSKILCNIKKKYYYVSVEKKILLNNDVCTTTVSVIIIYEYEMMSSGHPLNPPEFYWLFSLCLKYLYF